MEGQLPAQPEPLRNVAWGSGAAAGQELDRAVQAPGGGLDPVGAEGDAVDEAGVAVERGQVAARLHVPELHAPVLAARDELLAVGAEHQTPRTKPRWPRSVRTRSPLDRSQSRIVQIPAAGGDPPAVGAEGDRVDEVHVAVEGIIEHVILEVPDVDLPAIRQGELGPVGAEGDAATPPGPPGTRPVSLPVAASRSLT